MSTKVNQVERETTSEQATAAERPPIIELDRVSKAYGRQLALEDVSMSVRAGQVLCVLGDNGAGKSTLIKVLAGEHRPSTGRLLVRGEETVFDSPRQAQAEGISTVLQNLGLVDLMSVWRNFFLGAEITRRGVLDVDEMRRVTREEMAGMGVPIEDVDRGIGTLSGGQRQCVAIARAAHRGADVLILDEPTAALGVRQARLVLTLVRRAAERGVAVVLVTHNPGQAHEVADRFLVLQNGHVVLSAAKSEVTPLELTEFMAGNAPGADPGDVAAR